VAALAASGWAQDTVADRKKFMEEQMTKLKIEAQLVNEIGNAKVLNLRAGVMGPVVKGAPYSADEIHENTQVLADGTRIHNETKTTVYRDSQGRVRRESPGEVSIFDPTTGTSYMLNQSNQTAQKMGMAMSYVMKRDSNLDSSEPGQVRTFTFNTGDGPATINSKSGGGAIVLRNNVMTAKAISADNAKRENLGKQIIEGVSVDGTRVTNTIDAGAIGNDRPIQTTEELWYSPELQVRLLEKRNDPRTGEEITRLTNVRRIEPDPTLFVVPSTYHMAK
jgi:hypothetical protein